MLKELGFVPGPGKAKGPSANSKQLATLATVWSGVVGKDLAGPCLSSLAVADIIFQRVPGHEATASPYTQAAALRCSMTRTMVASA